MLFQEKAPYIVTLFFAMVAWALTHTVQQITESPTISYESRTEVVDGGRIAVVRIHNITRKFRLTNLRFTFIATDEKLVNAWLEPAEPAYYGNDPPVVYGKSASFVIPQFNPGWVMTMKVRYKGDRPRFHLEATDSPVRLLPVFIETWLVENELYAVWAGVMMAGLVLLLLVSERKISGLQRDKVSSSQIGGGSE